MLRNVEPLDNFFCPVNAGDPPPAKDNLPYQTPKNCFPRWISPIYLLESRHHGPGWPCSHSLLMQRLEAKIWEITGRNSPPCPPANPIARVISNLGWLLLYQNKPPNDLWKTYLMGGFTPIKTWGEVVVIHPERMFEGSHWKLATITFWWNGWET